MSAFAFIGNKYRMPDANDMELLRAYARRGSETAFAELVQRHIALVYSVALRHVEIAAQAEEVTQAVFIILARKAGGLRPDTILEGWLYETTRLTSLSFLRGERRRQFREQEAYMQSTLQDSADDAIWTQLAPLLDDAMSRLGKKDRDAVILRFFKDKSVRDVAMALNVTEAAAQRRVLRALEKLRKIFGKRGVSSTTAIIGGVISANSIHAAPVALAKSVTAIALTKGVAASASTLTLIKGALKIMAWTKVKMAVVATAVVFLAIASVAPHIWYYHLTPDSWRHRFEATYRLRNGELVRHISPPFIPERLTFYQINEPTQAKAIPSGPDVSVFRQDAQGKIHWKTMIFGGKQSPCPLREVLSTDFGLEPYEFEGPNNLLNLMVNGDWTISDSLTNQDTFLKALEPILFKITKHKIIFEKRTVERDVT